MSSPVPTETELDERNLLILYATETGTAQDAADYIARQCRRIAFKSRVVSIDKYALPDLVSEDLVVFVISTTGTGVEPRSMTNFWNMLLRSDLPSDLFEDLHFAVFGLGDTAYEKFCWPAKKLSRRLCRLDAKEICERGEGDEQHNLGIDGALYPWTEGFVNKLMQSFPLSGGLEAGLLTDFPPPRVVLKDLSQSDFTGNDPLYQEKNYHTATLIVNKRITAQDWFQDVRHLEFKLEDDIDYAPGDVAVIHPLSSHEDIETFLTTMNWGNVADDPLTIKHTMADQSFPDYIPDVLTLRTLFTRYLDFNAVPRRSFFQFFRNMTTDELEREKLDEFLSPEGADELYDYCYRVKRTILEVLSEFRHVKIPRDYVFDVFPPMRPRQFSIASSSKKHPRRIHLCVAIVRYRTKLRIPRRGVCTSYLAGLQPGDSIRVGVQAGFLKLPKDIQTPVICVGPGTGIAPMRAVIEERIFNGSYSNTLYFGCRSESKDHHYDAEWKSYAKDQQLVYRVAFSRDGPEGVKRTYVQDHMKEDAERIWTLVGKENASVLISGSSNKMPAAVRDAIKHAAEKVGGHSVDEAKKFLDLMVKEGRLIEECWS